MCDFSINSFRIELGSLQSVCSRFQKALHYFYIGCAVARSTFPTPD
jgi:hypothetical protein